MNGHDGSGKWFDEAALGERFARTLTVTELLPKPKQDGGIVVLKGVAVNQDGVTVAQAVGKILVANRPAAAGV